ncbi:MAG TPA: 4'-phosphopantetheinyl transferase superfamily protein [Stellaceae bacterium]|nr:4'-phosphopantetheinyl transferase superfamily protein [Stellaceae bacterium]
MMGPGRPRSTSPAFPALGPRRDDSDGTVAFERRLTLDSDLYLRDHVFGVIRSPQARDLSALPVMPMVMTLETLAEAGLAASREGRAVVAAVERLRLHRWLTLDRGHLDLRVVARPQPGPESALQRVDVELFELDEAAPAGRWSAAEATVVLAAGLPPPPLGRRLGGESIEPRWSPERYVKELIFQGPSLRCFHRLLRMTTEGIEAEVVVPPRDRLFRGDPAPMLATAASLMDGAGQTVARWVAEYWRGWDGLYPFSADGYEQFGPLPAPGERLRCVATVTDEGHVAVADVDFQRPGGAVLFRYRGFRQRRFAMTAELAACIRTHDADYAFARPFDAGVGLLGCVFDGGHHDVVRPERAIFLQTIAHTVLTAREREAWRAIPQASPRRARWLMGRVAAKEAIRAWAGERHGLSLSPVEIEIESDERGKPMARFIGGALSIPALEISISHADTLAVAVVAEDVSVGVDIEEERDGTPRTVPEIAFADGELVEATRAGVPPIALWCAKEAAAKALGVGLLGEPRRWRVQDLASDGRTAVVSIDGLCLPVTLHRRERALIAVAHASREVAAEARESLRVAGQGEAKPAL